MIIINKFVFIPIGSYEQHGPHLPPETDYLIAQDIAKKVAPIFNGEVIQGIKISISPEHKKFKNTKSISKKKFSKQVKEILNSYQIETIFFFINTHGGNNNTLLSIAEQYKNKMLVINTFSIIKDDLKRFRTSKIGGICHAGEFETSIMMDLFPNKVLLKKLKKNDVKYIPSLDPNYKFKKPEIWRTIDLSKSGILGDPFHASKEKGEIWLTSLIEKIKSLIEEFIYQAV